MLGESLGEGGQGCDCESECECEFTYGEDMEEDTVSERSYDREDAGYYYEMKERREERKREKLLDRKERELDRKLERTKDEEVRAAYESLKRSEKEGEEIPVGSLLNQTFELFCSGSVDYFCNMNLAPPTKRVDFYLEHPDKFSEGETGMLDGLVYLAVNTYCSFGPFQPPRHASRKAIKLTSDNGHELSFEFIGNRYLRLTVSREVVYVQRDNKNRSNPPSTGPEVFEFAGILRDRGRWDTGQLARMARRSPSPHESQFEMSHPMGRWRELE